MKNKALADIKVIDLTHYIAGPYCTKLMAGFGAEVIKIERPETGDRMRSAGPFHKNKEGLETSIPFLWLNTGKQSITLDLKTEKGVSIFKQLISDADVLVENFSPGVMQKLGLSYDTLCKINPALVMASISNFGQTGPYRDYKAEEIQMQAMSGIMYLTGDPESAPLSSGPAISQYTAGQHAYIAILMAMFQRGISGEGIYVDISIQECSLENIEIALTNNLLSGGKAKRGRHMMVPWDMYQCQDGYIDIISMPARHWHNAAEIFDDDRLFDKKYAHMRDRMTHRDEYEEILNDCVKSHKKKELFHKGQDRKLAFGYLAGLDDVTASPQHAERAFFDEIDHPVTGTHKYCGAPFKMSESPWRSARAPMLGEHNQDVYGGVIGYSYEEIKQLEELEVI